MTKKVREVIEILEADGWIHIRTKGDHRIFKKPGARRPIVVAGHLNENMPIGTYKSTLKQMKEGF
jgi:predicted RNA binding protein YcfA (HicA-like mRNA interferase family)